MRINCASLLESRPKLHRPKALGHRDTLSRLVVIRVWVNLFAGRMLFSCFGRDIQSMMMLRS